MKKLLLITICFLVACSKEKKSTNTHRNRNNSITIIFKNPNIKDTLFYSKNFFAVNEKQVYFRANNSFVETQLDVKNKTKTFKIKTSEPIYLYHLYYIKDFSYNAYCFYPNDTLTITYKEGVPFVKSANNIDYNHGSNFNLKFPLDFDENLFYHRFKRFKSFQEYKSDSLIRSKRDKSLVAFFDSIKNRDLIDSENYILNLSFIKNNEKINSTDPKTILNSSYNLADISNTYMVSSAFEKIYKPKFVSVSDGRIPDFRDQFLKATKIEDININNKEYLMFSMLESIAQRGSKEDFLECYKIFESKSQNSLAKVYFKKNFPLFFEFEESNSIETTLIDKNGKKINLENIIKNYNGKVIYIDFWASWCAPCRELLPSSIKLHDEYKNKDVVFLYISTDDDLKKWEKASIKEKLWESENNFLAINYPKAKLYQSLKLQTIPRYIIYDKSGKLVNSNAPNPKSEDIKIELERYLKK